LLNAKVHILVDPVLDKGCQNRNLDRVLPVHLVTLDKDLLWEKLLSQPERFLGELVELVVDVETFVLLPIPS
jgi:hypothetical protein